MRDNPTKERRSSRIDWNQEFSFELAICLWAEQNWPPSRDGSEKFLVGRQIGTKRRRWDTVLVKTTSEQLQQRNKFGSREFDQQQLHILKNAPQTWAWYREALPEPEYPWRYIREEIHRLANWGTIETRKQSNKIEIRRKWEYPSWIDRIVAIENKPDLDASAAKNLTAQLKHDIALGLADEAWVATRVTEDETEPVLFADLPVEAGAMTFNPSQMTAEVHWYPRQLAVDQVGTRIKNLSDDQNKSTCEFSYASFEWKEQQRAEIAERVYARGWRSYINIMQPDCKHFELQEYSGGMLPDCKYYGPCQRSRKCKQSCKEFEPEPPQWRTQGWPISGGPGIRFQEILKQRRQRSRKHHSNGE